MLLLAGVLPLRRAAADDPALEVQVTGDPAPQVGKRDPSGASRVLREEQLRAPGANAADLLTRVPGVQVSRAGAGSDLATVSIRGATSAETPVYFAGVRLNDDTTGTADLSLLPLWMIQRVEVYRTGAPFDADRLGPGGAVFFEPVLPRGSRVGAGLGAGSFGEFSTWVAGMIGDERAGAMAAVRRQSARNDYSYLDDRGTRFVPSDDVERSRVNADYTSYDLFTTGRVRLGRGSVVAVFSALLREQGITGLSVVPAQAARGRTGRMLGAVTTSLPCSAGDRCSIQLQTSLLLARNELDDPRRELNLLAPFVASTGERLVETARLRYRLIDVLALQASVSQELEQLGVDAPALPVLRARRAASRLTGGVVADLARAVELNALAALEYHATTATTAGGGGTFEPTARAGGRFRIRDGLEFLANVGRYARVPTLGELYGTSAVVRGNADLTAERGYVADSGARFALKLPQVEVFAEVFGFARFASDLIAYRRSSFGVVRPYNVAEARVLGVEVAASAKAWNHLRVEIALTGLDPRDTSATRTTPSDLLPFRARLVAVPSVEVFAGPFPALALDRVSALARLTYRAAYAADPAGLVVVPEQAPLDVELAFSFWKSRVTAQLVVSDLFDVARFDVVGLPLPRRGVHGSLEVWW